MSSPREFVLELSLSLDLRSESSQRVCVCTRWLSGILLLLRVSCDALQGFKRSANTASNFAALARTSRAPSCPEFIDVVDNYVRSPRTRLVLPR